jgi:hypothetical protein
MLDRLGVPTRFGAMARQHLRTPLAGLRRKFLDRGDDAAVQPRADVPGNAVVGDLVRQRVLEREFGLGAEPRGVQELTSLQASQAAADVLGGQLGCLLQERHRHDSTDHRGDVEHVFVGRREAVDARRDDVVHRPRHRKRGGLVGLLANGPRKLLQEERIALAAVQDAGHRRGGGRSRRQHRLYQLPAFRG